PPPPLPDMPVEEIKALVMIYDSQLDSSKRFNESQSSALIRCDLRQHVRSLRDHRHLRGGAVFGKALGHRLLDARRTFDEQAVDRFRRQTVADDFHAGFAAYFREFFELPL